MGCGVPIQNMILTGDRSLSLSLWIDGEDHFQGITYMNLGMVVTKFNFHLNMCSLIE